MASEYEIPKEMKAIKYWKPLDFSYTTVPVPELKPHEILVKVKSCGICGTDLHIHDGDFGVAEAVVTGHETSGIVVKMGSAVKGFELGDKVTADNSELCGSCHYCRKGQLLYCEDFKAHGLHLDGGFAEYCAFPADRLFKFSKLSWTDASLFEATSCALHGLDQLQVGVGYTALLIGSGPTGLCLAQLLRQNGARHVTVASNRGAKMDLARQLNCGDEYVDLDRENPTPQWEALAKGHPYGFDVVIEASGSHQLAEKAINYVTRGGKLLYYGVYAKDALVKVSPSKIFSDEITIIGSFSQMYCMQKSVDYLESGKVRVDGIVDRTYKLEQYGEALEAIRNKKCIKACIVMD